MTPRTRRILIVLLLLLLALLILLLSRCPRPTLVALPKTTPAESKIAGTVEQGLPTPKLAEVLTAASVHVPPQVDAGTAFRATWTGPNNDGDYLTIVRPEAKAEGYGNYRETRHGAVLELIAPMEPGIWEVRYVAVKSKKVLGRAAITVAPTAAVLTAPDEVMLGAPVAIAWTGPGNEGDFVCIVRKDAAHDQVGNFADLSKGSPVTILAPVESGEVEIRYVSGQGRKVLGRRKLVVLAPNTSVTAQASVVAGAKFPVSWKGPANAGDYITVVPRGTLDGQYRNYAEIAKGSTVELTAPIDSGEAEIRYMTGAQAKVLARRPISVLAANVTIEAADEVIAGSSVSIAWTGPNNANDYLTIVSKATPDGQYGNYTNAAKGSPLTITAPIRPGPSEIRYMSGAGAKVLARRVIAVVRAEIVLNAPAEAGSGELVTVEWKGPNHPGDYLTIVARSAKDGVAAGTVYTSKGSPAKIPAPRESGACEIRYMSGQNNVVLARTEIMVR
jgi:hypothetical protein